MSTSLRRFGSHKGLIEAVAISANGRMAVLGTDCLDGSISVWDIRKRRKACHLKGHPQMEGHAQGVNSVAICGDGGQVLSCASQDPLIRLWDVETSRQVRTLRGSRHKWMIRCVAISPDGRQALSGDDEGNVCLWDLRKGKELEWYRFSECFVNSVAFHADGTSAFMGLSGEVFWWDLQSREVLYHDKGHRGVVFQVLKCGAQIMSGSSSGPNGRWARVLAWDLRTRKTTKSEFKCDDRIRDVRISPDGAQAIAVAGGRAYLWKVATSALLQMLPYEAYFSAVFAPDGKLALVCSTRATVWRF